MLNQDRRRNEALTRRPEETSTPDYCRFRNSRYYLLIEDRPCGGPTRNQTRPCACVTIFENTRYRMAESRHNAYGHLLPLPRQVHVPPAIGPINQPCERGREMGPLPKEPVHLALGCTHDSRDDAERQLRLILGSRVFLN